MQWTAKGQQEWGWKIAAYLFVAGAGGGAYAVGAGATLLGERGLPVARAGVCLGFPLLVLGSLFLLADLGVKWRAWRAFLNPGSSWIARGTIIISGFMVLGAIHLAGWVWPFTFIEKASELRGVLTFVTLVFAVATMVYTGVLLGASKAIPLWSTGILPVLFLVSGLSTGTMAITLALVFSGTAIPGTFLLLARGDAILLALEMLVLGFYLQGTRRTEESSATRRLITGGSLAPLFWFGVVALGLVVPFLVVLMEALPSRGETGPEASLLLVVGAISGLAGGLLLRRVILAAGARGPLRAGGIEYLLAPVVPGQVEARRG